jgi:hypothetical protein
MANAPLVAIGDRLARLGYTGSIGKTLVYNDVKRLQLVHCRVRPSYGFQYVVTVV